MSTATTTATDYRCPKHPDERLNPVLRGGAGFCRRCNLYTQALGVPTPEPAPEIVAKRAAAERTKTRNGKRTAPKKRKAQARREAQQTRPNATKTSGSYKFFP